MKILFFLIIIFCFLSCEKTKQEVEFSYNNKLEYVENLLEYEPIRYEIFEGSVRFTAYDKRIKPLKELPELLLEYEKYGIISANENSYYFTDQEQVNDTILTLIKINIKDISEDGLNGVESWEADYKHELKNLHTAGYQIIGFNINSEFSEIEYMYRNDQIWDYTYVFNRKFNEIIVSFFLRVTETPENINFEKINLMKKSITIESPPVA